MTWKTGQKSLEDCRELGCSASCVGQNGLFRPELSLGTTNAEPKLGMVLRVKQT